jgi:hypothetical protein
VDILRVGIRVHSSLRHLLIAAFVLILVACTTVFVDDGANSVVIVNEKTTIDPIISEPIK